MCPYNCEFTIPQNIKNDDDKLKAEEELKSKLCYQAHNHFNLLNQF